VLWIILFFIATIIFVFTLFFADSAGRAVVQSAADGSGCLRDCGAAAPAASVDNAFHAGVGGLDPVAMERTLRCVDRLLVAGGQVLIPCDLVGAPS
jgi:hypothetical protein